MQFKGTIITQNNMSFAVAQAKYEDLRSISSRNAYLEKCQPYFENLPIILAAQDGEGNPIYFGDTKLITWLESQNHLKVEWENYGN